ncbi:hypothetical protein M0812_13888 [Anaeramoeba flamelloides]|uniref:Ras-GAP domain-containing protein n=1 Tax=Anaeramoeba flamelloides TaxID=1746091 RepID=A0AAV7ZJI5_9EUKA|nr:hypothetical protein M0812_13888 [Anaeramoeba flamelloides]
MTTKKGELTSEFYLGGFEQSKGVKNQLKPLIQKTKQYCSSVSNCIKAHQEFIKTYRLYSKTINNEEGEIEVVSCLIKTAELSSSLLHLNDFMQKKFSTELVQESQRWIDGFFKDLNKTKKEYERLKKQFESSYRMIENVKKKPDVDPKKKEIFEKSYEKNKKNLLIICGELYLKLDEIVSSKDSVLLEMMTNSLKAMQKYYYEGYTQAYNYFEYIEETKNKVQEMLGQYNVKTRDHDMKTLSKAQEDDETKFDSLVMCLSAPDQAIISSLIFATASDKDILASFIRIFEAYGETRSILQNCIIKEVEKTQSSAQLFRENTTSTKLTSSFTNIIGLEYRKNTLLPLVQWIQDNPRGYECRANKCPENETTEKNMKNVIETSQMFLEAIINSMEQAPL